MKIYNLVIIASLTFLSMNLNAQAINQSEVQHVKAEEFLKLIESGEGQLVDIRTPKEYKAGHIRGAIMVDYYAPTYKEYLSKLDKETPIYIYCRSGNRTGRSVALLQQLGFKKIVNLHRGLIDWNNSGYTLVQQ